MSDLLANPPVVKSGEPGGRDAAESLTNVEIAKLRDILSSKKKWWKDYPLCISVLAFLLSLTTSVISIYTSRQKDLHDQQAELSSALRSIQELNIKTIEIREKYKGKPDEAHASDLISNQIHNTIILASEIAFKLGTNATTPTVLPLSQRLYNVGEYERASRLAELARDAARSVDDQVGALRWLGFIKIKVGSREMISAGGKDFQRALDATQELQLSRLPALNAWMHAVTQLDWARALSGLDCEEARNHFAESAKILDSAVHNIDLDRLRENVKRQQAEGIDGNRACPPRMAVSSPSEEQGAF
jgi:hypothetical protein